MAGRNWCPWGTFPSRAHQELDPEDHIVVVCHHGVRSMNVTAWLRQQGFEKAQSMRGGIDAWSRRVEERCRRTEGWKPESAHMITDCHIHISPLEMFKPQALELMKRSGRTSSRSPNSAARPRHS
jgi:hypothetical protein